MLSNLANWTTVTNTNNYTAIGDETSLIKLVTANIEFEDRDWVDGAVNGGIIQLSGKKRVK